MCKAWCELCIQPTCMTVKYPLENCVWCQCADFDIPAACSAHDTLHGEDDHIWFYDKYNHILNKTNRHVFYNYICTIYENIYHQYISFSIKRNFQPRRENGPTSSAVSPSNRSYLLLPPPASSILFKYWLRQICNYCLFYILNETKYSKPSIQFNHFT